MRGDRVAPEMRNARSQTRLSSGACPTPAPAAKSGKIELELGRGMHHDLIVATFQISVNTI
jgi:hypothetical protein